MSRSRVCAVALALVLALASTVRADVYMHNPRGSNDRNCERNVNRRNANRLFDSQNNAKGGYACPRAVGGPIVMTPQMYYYVGSKIPIEWTAQHGCGSNPKEICQGESGAPGCMRGRGVALCAGCVHSNGGRTCASHLTPPPPCARSQL